LEQHTNNNNRVENKMKLALGLTLLILAVEAIGGVVSNSLALLADAGHMLTDVFAVGLSLYALIQSRRPADHKRTFGYHRVTILIALLNSATLLPLSVYIIWEAVGRFSHPEPIQGGIMFAVALVGLVANLLIGLNLHGEADASLNVRSAVIHVMGDAAASGGVLIAALVIAFTGWTPIDPILSIGIALLVAFSGWRVVRESVGILMESVPRGIDISLLIDRLQGVPGVRSVHDLHVWQISQGINALSCHVIVADQAVSRSASVLASMNMILQEEFNIGHSTIQPECIECDPNALYCQLTPLGTSEHSHSHSHEHEHAHIH
jgi:cobalt-zinc-cadmium efflux system protein